MEEIKKEVNLIDYYYEEDKEELKEKLNSDNLKIRENANNFLHGYKCFKDKDYKEALKFFSLTDDTYYTALMYLYGLGCKQKEKKAFKMLRDNLNDKVNVHLALMLLYGYGCDKDVEKAYNLVIDEANKNDLKSMLLIYKYYEYNHNENKLKYWADKIINSNDYSVDFAIFFNNIYLDILLKNNAREKIKLLVNNAILNNDFKTYEDVVSYYYENEQYKDIIKLYRKKLTVSKETKTKVKNAKIMYKAQKIDQNIKELKDAKTTLRIYHIKMFYLGCGTATYITSILLYFVYFLLNKNGISQDYVYLILSTLFSLASICLLFFSTRIKIKDKLNLYSLIIIFNQISSLLLIGIATIISLTKYKMLMPLNVYPLIVILIVHCLSIGLGLFFYFNSLKLKKEIANN